MLKQLLSVTALLLVTSELFAQSVVIRGVRLTGSGCDAATASASVTSDGQLLSVLFDDYNAQIGIGSTNPQASTLKKDCRVLIDVDVPFGMQYAIERTEYRGFAALPASAYGYHRFTQVIPGQVVPSLREAQLRGPVSGNYEVIVAQKPGRSPFSKCNSPQQTIELLSELSVAYLPGSRDRSMAMINLDSIDTGINSRFKLTWRPCR
ncbi:DUF4360 domain-containing protein [bacterium]|nr:DUF4360 domain-containing protein [bacterium]